MYIEMSTTIKMWTFFDFFFVFSLIKLGLACNQVFYGIRMIQISTDNLLVPFFNLKNNCILLKKQNKNIAV